MTYNCWIQFVPNQRNKCKSICSLFGCQLIISIEVLEKKAKCNNSLREIYKHWPWFFCKEIMTFQGSITGSLFRIKIYLGCHTMLLPTNSLSQYLYAYITMTKFAKYFHHIKNLV